MDDEKLSHERAGRLLAGGSVLVFTSLAWMVDPLWLIPLGLVGLNLLASGATDTCLVKGALVAMGLPGERELGRAEARRHELGALR